jgi:hypothetical protein
VPGDERSKLHFAKGLGRPTSYFAAKGSSYEWFPFFEGENVNAPRIVGRWGSRTLPPSRVRLLMDYAENGDAPHNRTATSSVMQTAFGDGSVRQQRE